MEAVRREKTWLPSFGIEGRAWFWDWWPGSTGQGQGQRETQGAGSKVSHYRVRKITEWSSGKVVGAKVAKG